MQYHLISSHVAPVYLSSLSAIRWALPSPHSIRYTESNATIPAVLSLHRRYATETSTHDSRAGSFPPPGFDVKKAKQPPPQAETASHSSNTTSSEPRKQQTQIDPTQPTATDKTKALENASLSEIAAAKEASEPKSDDKTPAKKQENKKLTLKQKIKKEAQHYWDGTKLLATEVRISTKLALKMAAGYELSRREDRQVRPEDIPGFVGVTCR